MIQARIPEAILARLPLGVPTAPLLRAIRSGEGGDVPPELVAWVRRNGFHEGEEVELLPPFVVAPRPDRAAVERRRYAGRRHLLGLGWRCLLFAPIPTGILGATMALRYSDRAWGPFFLIYTGGIFLLGQLSPVLAAALIASILTGGGADVAAEIPVPMAFAVALGATSYVATIAGYALVARARGYSPFVAAYGLFGVLLRDRNVP